MKRRLISGFGLRRLDHGTFQALHDCLQGARRLAAFNHVEQGDDHVAQLLVLRLQLVEAGEGSFVEIFRLALSHAGRIGFQAQRDRRILQALHFRLLARERTFDDGDDIVEPQTVFALVIGVQTQFLLRRGNSSLQILKIVHGSTRNHPSSFNSVR
ncbi:MAG TPA: hypothetical protein VM659_07305 [Dongiaceae bacterium]|nr:hypothetical protein [Dongiaceae bacterium]